MMTPFSAGDQGRKYMEGEKKGRECKNNQKYPRSG